MKDYYVEDDEESLELNKGKITKTEYVSNNSRSIFGFFFVFY